MSKNFNELDRERCMHCGKWDKECSLNTLDTDIENYGKFAVCRKCLSEHDKEYWIEWSKKKLIKMSNKC